MLIVPGVSWPLVPQETDLGKVCVCNLHIYTHTRPHIFWRTMISHRCLQLTAQHPRVYPSFSVLVSASSDSEEVGPHRPQYIVPICPVPMCVTSLPAVLAVPSASVPSRRLSQQVPPCLCPAVHQLRAPWSVERGIFQKSFCARSQDAGTFTY